MPERIRALTLWQPWPTLIAIGAKQFETRSWPTNYRGPLAIHAGSDRRGLAWCRDEPAIETALCAAGYTLGNGSTRARDGGLASVPLGCIVAVADLIECWPSERIVAAGLADPFGDYSPGRFGWHLARVRPLAEPIRCIGRQGLWWPPVTVQHRLVANAADERAELKGKLL